MNDDSTDALPEPTPAPGAATEPTVETPATGTPTAEVASAPAAAGAPEATAAVPVTAPATSSGRRGLFVPAWAVGIIAALVTFGLGFGIGYAVGDHGRGGGDDRTARFGPMAPGTGNRAGNGFGMGPDGGGFGGNGGRLGPNGGGNGSGNGGGRNGGGSGNSTSARVFLGVAAQDSSNPAGATLVRVVAGSPAADAGLHVDDVVTKIGDTAITDAASLTRAVRSHRGGDTISVTYTRGGQSATASVTLASDANFSQQ